LLKAPEQRERDVRRLRMGMIGGGPGAFIGPIHRIAAELDREIELAAGAFSSQAEKSTEAGVSYRIDPARAYPDVETMLREEASREDGIDFVSVVSPNHHHFAATSAAISAGFPVISDKPMTATLEDAAKLAQLVEASGLPYGLTYTYSGYPLAREMRSRVASGELGAIRKVVVEYPQGWLSQPAEGKQAEWRVDPDRAGAGGCIGDIGVHAFHLAEFVTGLKVTRILADLASVVPGRALDDDCTVLLRFENGARGVLLASQIEIGELNGIRIRLYGDKAGMSWKQEEPNTLTIHRLDGRTELIRSGDAQIGASVAASIRTPGGHPEGYLEAFANLYRDFAKQVRGEDGSLLPGAADGLRGMKFIDTAVRASAAEAGWVDLE